MAKKRCYICKEAVELDKRWSHILAKHSNDKAVETIRNVIRMIDQDNQMMKRMQEHNEASLDRAISIYFMEEE